jgi:hypothetical protein
MAFECGGLPIRPSTEVIFDTSSEKERESQQPWNSCSPSSIVIMGDPRGP